MPNHKHILDFRGKQQGLTEWSKETGIAVATILSRLSMGWSIEDALTKPPNTKFRKGGRPKQNSARPCPKLLHNLRGKAYVQWKASGKAHRVEMGDIGSESAKSAYRRFQIDWANGKYAAGVVKAEGVASVGHLIVRWIAHCEKTYVKRGKPTSEVHMNRSAMRPLALLWGGTLVEEIDIPKLELVKEEMIGKGWARNTINAYLTRIKRMFAWGVRQKIVAPTVAAEVGFLDMVVAGRTEAKESRDRLPVPDADVEAVMPHLHPLPGRRAVFEALIRFHILTGMRPGEICSMTPEDLIQDGELWRYEVTEFNKTLHLDRPRRVFIGPAAQAILKPVLATAEAGKPVFRLPPARRGSSWSPITRHRYRLAVANACEAAGVEHWQPHRLRHNRATNVMKRYESDDAVAAAIGDSPEVARQVYVDSPADAVAKRIAREMG